MRKISRTRTPLRTRILSLVAAGALVCSLVPATAFADNVEPTVGTETYATGGTAYLPPWMQKASNTARPIATYANEILPEKYNLMDEGKATPARNQYQLNVCWAFGTLGALESNLLVSGETAQSADALDLSEHHLAWFGYEPVPEGTQAGEGLSVYGIGTEHPTWGIIYHMTAATATLAPQTLLAWVGAETEADFPFEDSNGSTNPPADPNNDTWALDAAARTNSTVHLTDYTLYPSPMTFDGTDYVYSQASVDAIKQAILEHGAVTVFYYATGDPQYFNTGTWAQYTSVGPATDATTTPNHFVTIVGWDDTYSADGYGTGNNAPGDGAWIIKNSWGTENFGIIDDAGNHTGCFYLSYYDKSAMSFVSLQGDSAENGFEYTNNLQYDYLGLGTIGDCYPTTEESRVANVFTVDSRQELGAVSTMVFNFDTAVTTSVYLLDADAQNPEDGTLVATKESYFPSVGYHTIELDTPVVLESGQRFSVVQTHVYQEGADTLYESPIEIGPTDESEEALAQMNGLFKMSVVANPGESYRYTASTGWQDVTSFEPAQTAAAQGIYLENGNVMIKAFTNDLAEPTPTPTPDPEPEPTPTPTPTDPSITTPTNSAAASGSTYGGALAPTGDPTMSIVVVIATVAAVAVVLIVIAAVRTRREQRYRPHRRR